MGEDGDFLNRKDYDEDGYGKVSDTVKPQDGLLYYYQKNGGMELVFKLFHIYYILI